MNEKEILALAYDALNRGELCRIKLPNAKEIHDFNMHIKELENKGYISIQKRNMTEIVLELTEDGLEAVL